MPNILLETSGEITPEKNEETKPKQKQYPVVDVTGDGSKVQCCEEQYSIEEWRNSSGRNEEAEPKRK